MGAKDSKRTCLSYEDAVKRMSDVEFKRVCEAFKRLTNGGQLLSRQAFSQNVLGEGIPLTITEWLYNACGGGPRGISQRDLICGLVLLTKGTQEEKIKFLWTLYCNDSGTHIVRSEFQSALQNEGTLPSMGNLNKPNLWWEKTLMSLFGNGQDRVGFDHFRAWIQYNKEATILSKWLLTNSCVTLSSEVETPTFYQTLAGVTHLEEQDICELEKCFWSLQSSSPSGNLDLTCVTSLVSPPVPTSACQGLFLALDVNRDGHVDFKELCCGISAACRGPMAERMKFCFKIFDMDRDGVLNTIELQHMIEILLFVAKENQVSFNIQTLFEKQSIGRQSRDDSKKKDTKRNDSKSLTDSQGKNFQDGFDGKLNVEDSRKNADSKKTEESRRNTEDLNSETLRANLDEIYAKLLRDLKNRLNSEGGLTQEEFLIWSVDRNFLIAPLLELLFQVCHVSLGLKPFCRHHEYEIVTGWLDREERRGYRVGQFWYLVSSDWWQSWIAYTTAPRMSFDHCTCRPDRFPIEEGIVCDESFTSNCTDYTSHSNEFTSNSTESMGDLLSRGDSCSIASSSGVSSSSGTGTSFKRNQLIPGPIDNSILVAEPLYKVPTLTGEGGRLKRDTPLVQRRDFELIPDSLWKALALWYGGPLPLPRQVIKPPGCNEVELELYPLNLRILRHHTQQNNPPASWSSVVGGYGAAALSTAGLSSTPITSPRRYLAHTAAFSRLANIRQVVEFLSLRLGLRIEDVRVWHVKETTTLLEDEYATLQDLYVQDNDQLLLEVRNKDLTWPEELGALASGNSERRPTITLSPGATGLHNLGNTCFMNAALQAVSNTRPLTLYFQRDGQLCELNSSNPLGTKGQVARRYAELCRELWAGSTRSVAPLKLRWCVSKHAPHLGGGGQHDSQELLAWLLDALHEDLNRVARKQYTELRDSDGRPDTIVAEEAWQQHLARDHSIITDLFYGQLKSKVTCQTCGHESVRFDPFNLLSLPLPMESFTLCEVLVIRLNGQVPVKYGLRLNSEAKYSELKDNLEILCDIPSGRLFLAEVAYSQIKQVLSNDNRINPATATEIYAYELPDTKIISTVKCEDEDPDLDLVESQSPLARSPEVRGSTALCMPNILCFKSNRTNPDKERFANGLRYNNASISIQPAHSNIYTDTPQCHPPSYLIAVHRKIIRQETYFLSQHKSKHGLFGVPILIGCNSNSTCQSIYEAVWNQVTRLLSPLPQSDQTNHAMDCDDSLGYEFPFTLKAVLQGGNICALCHWTQFCCGCKIPCNDEYLFDVCKAGQNVMCIAIDWDPTALHLRYQSGREKVWFEHESVAVCKRQHTEPIDLDYCLKAFTSEERLEAKYHCSNCQDKQPATKKLQIWRLPPILIIHLKRFDCVNNKWVKTQKVVNFPFKDFDPTAYLASVPQETILRHKQLLEQKAEAMKIDNEQVTNLIPEEQIVENSEEQISDKNKIEFMRKYSHVGPVDDSYRLKKIMQNGEVKRPPIIEKSLAKRRQRLESTSLIKTPIIDGDLRDFHEHKLLEGQDPFDLKYQLYAVVSHSGMLNGGHYISYACNPNGNWYCYNDSSCREVPTEPTTDIPTNSTENNNNLKSKNLDKSDENLVLKSNNLDGKCDNCVDSKTNDVCDDVTKCKSSKFKSLISNDSYLHRSGNETPTSQSPTPSLKSLGSKSDGGISKESSNSFRCSYSNAKIPKIDTSSAYILFYERSGLDYQPYLPDIVYNNQSLPEVELDENESELRKQLCNLQ